MAAVARMEAVMTAATEAVMAAAVMEVTMAVMVNMALSTAAREMAREEVVRE